MPRLAADSPGQRSEPNARTLRPVCMYRYTPSSAKGPQHRRAEDASDALLSVLSVVLAAQLVLL